MQSRTRPDVVLEELPDELKAAAEDLQTQEYFGGISTGQLTFLARVKVALRESARKILRRPDGRAGPPE